MLLLLCFSINRPISCNPLSEIKINKVFQDLCGFLNLKDHCLQKRDLVLFSNLKLIVKVTEEHWKFTFHSSCFFSVFNFYLLKIDLTDGYSLCLNWAVALNMKENILMYNQLKNPELKH